MGVESYGVKLVPIENWEAPVTVSAAIAVLRSIGFAPLPPRRQEDGARFARRPRNRLRFQSTGPDAVLEAQVVWSEEGGVGPTRGSRLVSEIGLRFAVCQGEAATHRFLFVARALATVGDLELHEEAGAGVFRASESGPFERAARRRVALLRRNWRRLFPVGRTPRFPCPSPPGTGPRPRRESNGKVERIKE